MASSLTSQKPMLSARIAGLSGDIAIPGDKSISHRALLLSSQVIGRTEISGLLEGDDVLHTKSVLEAMGVAIERLGPQHYRVDGVGIGGLHEPEQMLDMGNSGTGARLMMGLVSSYAFTSFFCGDASLSKRPMQRVIAPLSQSTAEFVSRSGGRLPLSVQGRDLMLPISYTLPVASAQVKSAILLAGLNLPGMTKVTEPIATRDHTERMLRFFGIAVKTEQTEAGTTISLLGQQSQQRQDRQFTVPSDPSSAAFATVAALITPNSELTLRAICINPLRIGLYRVLKEMGGDIQFVNEREEAGEPVADIIVKSSRLRGVTVPADIAPSMIDEYPILAIAAAFADGTSRMHGLEELRVKESDRLAAIIEGLHLCGVEAEAEGDDLIVVGTAGHVKGGGRIATYYDHRIAMSFLVMGMASDEPVVIDDASAIATSYPDFIESMNKIGAQIKPDRRRCVTLNRDAPLIIAIDGPAASGKGTLARRLSERLRLPYLDTGSLYRAVGMKLVYADQDPSDKKAAIAAAKALNEFDFTNPRLRQEKVGQAASIISAMPEVRQILLDYQRDFAHSGNGAILDGRDIGTVVCPDADLKLFMTASIDARAARRHRQLQGQGIEVVYDSVRADLIERDARDSARQTAPMIPADDAIQLDTTLLNANDVFSQILLLLDERLGIKAA